MSTREQLAEVIRDGEGVWRTPLEAADAILAAGFGKLADAWDEGWNAGAGWPQDDDNPYRSAS